MAAKIPMDAGMGFRIIVTKRDLASPKDALPELEPLRAQGHEILETSAAKSAGVAELRALLAQRTVVLAGHSGVGKTSLLNALAPGMDMKTGAMSRYGTGRQTTTSARWIPIPGGGVVIDTPGLRTLSVRGLDRSLLARVFPEFPAEWIDDPSGLDPEDEDLDLEYPERLHSLKRLWDEMAERNPNQRGA